MSTTFVIKAIKPQRLQVGAIVKEIEKGLKAEAKAQQSELKKTVSTWREKPDFKSDTDTSGGNLAVLTGPAGNAQAAQRWVWLDQGTSIRWALMSQDWKSKTSPKQFKSGRGKGRVVIAGRRAMQRRGIAPRPGIKARQWSEILTERRKRPFQRAMIKAVQRGAQKAF